MSVVFFAAAGVMAPKPTRWLSGEMLIVPWLFEIAANLIEAVRAQIAREEQTIISIREGRYQGSYAKS